MLLQTIQCLKRQLFGGSMTLVRAKSSSGGASSHIWLERQRKDPYVKRAAKETYRARSAFKLLEINAKWPFIRQGDVVIDVGAAPGSWSQVAVKLTNADKKDSSENAKVGLVVSVDRDFIEALDGAQVIDKSDITDPKTLSKIRHILGDRKVNSVVSDMAPNATGCSTLDHDAIIELQRHAFRFAKSVLAHDGTFLCKLWHGDSIEEFKSELATHFGAPVRNIKPPSSRSDSAEVFLFCTKFRKEPISKNV